MARPIEKDGVVFRREGTKVLVDAVSGQERHAAGENPLSPKIGRKPLGNLG